MASRPSVGARKHLPPVSGLDDLSLDSGGGEEHLHEGQTSLFVWELESHGGKASNSVLLDLRRDSISARERGHDLLCSSIGFDCHREVDIAGRPRLRWNGDSEAPTSANSTPR